MKNNIKVAVIGGGVAGSSISIYLGKLGIDVSLFEKNDSIVSGPPICHLHAGGNLYREISDESCMTLLKESIDLLKFYPEAIDYRPTVLAVPKSDKGDPKDLFNRLELLQKEYSRLIDEDSTNEVLCSAKEYFKIYSKEELEELKYKVEVNSPSTFNEWMIPVAKNIDFDKLKFPLIMVQEYGLNIFRLSASASIMINKSKNINLFTNTEVINIFENNENSGYNVEYKKDYQNKIEHFDYLINAAGFRTGMIDDMLKFKVNRLVEFKSAYVTKWHSCLKMWPEVIFFGQRGTPTGMAQFTPYPNGYFQIHGMTEDITLFKNGLVKNTPNSSQPKLSKEFIEKIDKSWDNFEIELRTKRAIAHIKQYIPSFKNVEVSSKPLYGAQQIPGDEASLRTADVSFEKERYARCEIVKASSILTMIDEIVKKFVKLGFLESDSYGKRKFLYENLNGDLISKDAVILCEDRGYPTDMAYTNNSSNRCNNL